MVLQQGGLQDDFQLLVAAQKLVQLKLEANDQVLVIMQSQVAAPLIATLLNGCCIRIDPYHEKERWCHREKTLG